MLDIDKLNTEFDKILSSFNDEKIQQWLDFAEQRELMERFISGESVDIILDKVNPQYIECIFTTALYSNAGENNYALAA